MKTYRLTQRWSPALAGREGRIFRPHLVVVVDESEGSCPAVGMVEDALRPAALARWLADKIGKTRPGILWVDDPTLVGPMSMYFPHLRVSCQENAPRLNEFLAGLLVQMPPEQKPELSLVQQFGADQALPFYGAARDFYAAKPWEGIPSSERLSFHDRRGRDWSVVVLGSEGQEFGVSLVDEHGTPPTCGVVLHEPAYLAAADLDRIDYLQQPLDQEWLAELRWLLDALGQLQKSPLQSDGRKLGPPRSNRCLDRGPTRLLAQTNTGSPGACAFSGRLSAALVAQETARAVHL